MTIEKNNNGLVSRVVWAALSPVILAAVALSIVGIVLIPALCIYLDRRSRTYTAAISLIIFAVIISITLGAVATGFCTFIVLAALAACLCVQLKAPFKSGLVISAAGGVLGLMAALAIINFSLSTPINIAATDSFLKWASQFPSGMVLTPLDVTVLYVQMSKGVTQTINGYFELAAKLPSMASAEKIALVKADLEYAMIQLIPAFSLIVGLVTGALGYYFGRLAISAHERKIAKPDDINAVPPFATFRMPKYIVISLLLLQLFSMLGLYLGWESFDVLNLATYELLNLLMIVQALALAAYFMNRRRIHTALQVLILVPVTAIFSGIMVWIGLFDVLFNLRVIAARIDALKASGKQVFTKGGLEDLGRMDDKDKKDRKDDGEDGKK